VRVKEIGQIIMMTNRIGGLTAGNAAFNWMNASNSLMGLTAFRGNSRSLLSAEQNLTSGMLNDSLMYKAGLLQEESMKKIQNENIKRTFSIFA